MKQSSIIIDVQLDEHKVPHEIWWNASDSTADDKQIARAMLLSFWDPTDKAALRIDLWTKNMMVDEMVDFFYQSFMGMADTLERSTGQKELVHDFRHFAKDFFKKFQALQQGQNPTPPSP